MISHNARSASAQSRFADEFTETAAYAEQAIYRKIVRHCGDFTKSQRAVLAKFVNLWFYHRGRDGFVSPTHERLQRSLKIAERTLRLAIKRLCDLGFIKRIGGGDGRGRRASYVVDLTLMQEVLAPEIEVGCCGERVTLDGEIKGAKSGAEKGAKTPAAIYRIKKHRSKSSRGLVVWLPKAVTWDTLGTLGRRLNANRMAWFRPKPNYRTGWPLEAAA